MVNLDRNIVRGLLSNETYDDPLSRYGENLENIDELTRSVKKTLEF